MKRLICATLALTLLSGTAAVAAPYDHGRGDTNSRDYNSDYRGDRGRDNSGAIVAGVGLLAIAAILASQSHHYEHGYNSGWYNGGNRYGHYDHYNRGYDGRNRW